MPKFEGDPYETEYAVIEEIEILREGVWNGYPYNQEFIEEISLTYDPSVVRAPLMLGHWGEGDGPEQGHVLALKAVDVKTDTGYVSLRAVVGFLESAAELIKGGMFNERSISWWDWYPMKGFAYLLHLALLGDANPGSVGMDPIIFSPLDKDSEFGNESENEGDLNARRLNTFNAMAMALSFKPENLRWSKESDEDNSDIRFEVRKSSRFQPGTMRIRQISKKDGIRALAGTLKSEYLPDGKSSDAVFNQYILFSEAAGWTLKKAKNWIESRKSLDIEAESGNIDNDTGKKTVTNNIELIPGLAPDENNSLTATAEGGLNMVTDTETIAAKVGQDGKVEEVVKEEELKKTTLSEELAPPKAKVQSRDITLIQPGNIQDKQKTTAELQLEIDTEKGRVQEEYDELEKELLLEKFNIRHAQCTAQCRTLLATGHLIPSQFELGIVECLAAIPDELAITETKTDGTKSEHRVRDRLLDILKEGGRVKLRGEVTPRVDESQTAGPNADLDRLDAQGVDTRSERLRRKFTEAEPEKNQADIMVMVEAELRKDGGR